MEAESSRPASSPRTLAAILERAGFEVLEVARTVNHYPPGDGKTMTTNEPEHR